MMKNLLVSGYRAHELNIFSQKHEGIPYIKKAIAGRLIPLIEEGLEWVITPGQYGVDLWACEVAIALKQQYPHLKCSIMMAYQGMDVKRVLLTRSRCEKLGYPINDEEEATAYRYSVNGPGERKYVPVYDRTNCKIPTEELYEKEIYQQ